MQNIETVPYQVCPLCNGKGSISCSFSYGYFAENICTVCNGAKIIPMHVINYTHSCPCMYLEIPCNPHCSCINSLYSNGCDYCCTHGSLEQKKENAILISNKLKNDKT